MELSMEPSLEPDSGKESTSHSLAVDKLTQQRGTLIKVRQV